MNPVEAETDIYNLLFICFLSRDREDKMLSVLWPGIKSHVRRCPYDLLINYIQLLNAGSTAKSSSYSTYK